MGHVRQKDRASALAPSDNGHVPVAAQSARLLGENEPPFGLGNGSEGHPPDFKNPAKPSTLLFDLAGSSQLLPLEQHEISLGGLNDNSPW
jgi:hypothetical protein